MPRINFHDLNILKKLGPVLPKERSNRIILYFIILAAILSGLFLQILTQLPNVETISVFSPSETTEIYASDGTVLAKASQGREPIRYPA